MRDFGRWLTRAESSRPRQAGEPTGRILAARDQSRVSTSLAIARSAASIASLVAWKSMIARTTW